MGSIPMLGSIRTQHRIKDKILLLNRFKTDTSLFPKSGYVHQVLYGTVIHGNSQFSDFSVSSQLKSGIA